MLRVTTTATATALRRPPLRFRTQAIRHQWKRHRMQNEPTVERRDEEYHIARALRWMKEKPPRIVCTVENVSLAGLHFLPAQVNATVRQAAVRLRVLTHADTLSDAALQQQLALVAAQDRQAYGQEQPTLALNLSESDLIRTKQVRSVREAFWGATLVTNSVNSGTLLVCGLPNAGKSSLIQPLTRHRTLQVKKKGAYHLPITSPRAGRTLGLKKHVLEEDPTISARNTRTVSLIDSPGMRPRVEDLDPRAVGVLLAARVLEPFAHYRDVVSDHTILTILLEALNRHAAMSSRSGGTSSTTQHYAAAAASGDASASPDGGGDVVVPDYVAALGLEGPTTDVQVFWEAYQKVHWGKNVDAWGLIRQCQRGELGGQVFAPPPLFAPASLFHSKPSSKGDDDDVMKLYRDRVVVYHNEAAQRLMDIANGAVEYVPIQKQPRQQQPQSIPSGNSPLVVRRPGDGGHEKSSPPSRGNKENDRNNINGTTTIQNSNNNNNLPTLHAAVGDKPLPIPIVHPRHQQGFNCLKCAGFIKRNKDDGRPYGCRHTRVQTWSYKDILNYFSRMCEAFGGLHSAHTRYLFRDSLACTLAIKYKKRSRRAIYVKFAGLKDFPVPNEQRPRRYQIDQPIPFVHRCKKLRGQSCTEIDMSDENYLKGPYGFYGTKHLLDPHRKWKPIKRKRKKPKRQKLITYKYY